MKNNTKFLNPQPTKGLKMTNIVKSITPRAIMGIMHQDLIGTTLYNVKGVVQSSFEKTTKFGQSTGFKGYFVAVRLDDGEVFESEAAFFPKDLTAQLEKKLNDDQNNEILVEASIKVVPSDKSDMGYAIIADTPITKEFMAMKAKLIEAVKAESQALLA